jgi:hypothetical protein
MVCINSTLIKGRSGRGKCQGMGGLNMLSKRDKFHLRTLTIQNPKAASFKG